MKTFEKVAAQGDVRFTRIAKLPADAKLKSFPGNTVVAHSETGHDHIFAKNCGVQFYESSNPMIAYLKCEAPMSELEHLRPFDTHESLGFTPGVYEVRRQREETPEGWRRVAD